MFNVLLQLLDDGRLTDGQGRTVDFRNTVVVMTSNLSGEEALRAHFRPEFLNRVDDVVVFRPLSREDLDRIVDLQIARLDKLLAERQLVLKLTAAARELIVERGYDPVYGARPLKRVIQRMVQNPLALAVLEGEFGEGDRVAIDAGGDGLRFEKVHAAAATAS